MTSKDMMIELLKAYDPDDLRDYAIRVRDEQEKEKKKAAEDAAKKAKIEEARKKVVDAMKEYSKALYGVEADIKVMDNFNMDLKKIEDSFDKMEKSFLADDEKIRRFVRGIL